MHLLLSSAYAPPIQYFAKLYAHQGQIVLIEAHEHYVKQSYRNRCHIVDSTGIVALTTPVVHRSGERLSIRDVRISAHNDWRRQHLSALATAYGASPYFEYYWDDVRSVIERSHTHLWELNWELILLLARLINMELELRETDNFAPVEERPLDYRYRIRPRQPLEDATFMCPRYYQPFAARTGFIGGLSMLDLLFNMGPESLIVLRDSIKSSDLSTTGGCREDIGSQ